MMEMDQLLSQYIGARIDISTRKQFLELSEGIYPVSIISKMKNDLYRPEMIAYIHEREVEIYPRMVLSKMLEGMVKDIRVGLEINEVELGWVTDFKIKWDKFQQEYQPGNFNHEAICESGREYMNKLSFHQRLALWILQKIPSLRILPLESNENLFWKERTEDNEKLKENLELRLESDWQNGLLFYKAIPRNIHNLIKINELRPDIICVGAAHAFVYDILLERDCTKYVLCREFIEQNLPKALPIQRECHNLYRKMNRSP